jgi:L-ascorbate metabolism protein UlaG (beta-lactamase superfamily)
VRITYIGHATLLIEIGGRRFLTDPNFDPALGRFLPRVSEPGIALGALPALDGILLSHAHADHLSFASLDALPRTIPLLAPATIARWLRARGYAHAEALNPGDGGNIGGVTIRAAGAKHVGSRYAVDRWRSATNMYLLDADEETVFFAGDTALTPETHHMVRDHVMSGGRQLDVALLPIGHAPWWKFNFRRGHLTSDDALQLFDRLDAKVLIPYHWGTFRHVTAGAHDAIVKLRARLPRYDRHHLVKIIEPGEVFELAPAT